MPPVTATTEEKKDAGETAPSKPTIGIIYPPPEVRNIVDKTASFVARNGPEFQTRIRQNEQNNPKFNFLNTGDPYHAYYQHKVKEFKENDGKIQEPVIQPLMSIPTTKIKPSVSAPQVTIIEPEIPKEAPPEYEFLADPPSISSLDLDIVRLTAQFVARNGRQFLTNLMNREQRNYQFDFLRPQHSLFNYFTKLVEQYTKVLIPPGDIKERLREKTDNPFKILDNVNYRVRWARHQEQEKQKVEDEKEKERVSFAQIDWHDFVVVETVEFKENETGNLPPPVTLEQLGARILAQERSSSGKDDDEEAKEKDEEFDMMDIEMDDEDEAQAPPPPKDSQKDNRQPSPPRPQEPPPPQPPLPPMAPGTNIQIRKDYNPKQAKALSGGNLPDSYLISPITGEKVPAHEFDEHMKISLLDPKWKEQRDRYEAEKKQQESVFASGSSMETNLKHIAQRRTDIFGAGDVETFIGQRIGEEDVKQPEKVTWDGHTASISATAQKAAAGISLEEQIEQIHKQIGMVADKEKEAIGPKPSANNPPPPPHNIQPPRLPPPSQPVVRPPPPPVFAPRVPMPPNMPRMPPAEPRNAPPPPQMLRPPVPPPQRFMGMPPPMQPPPFIRPDVQAAPPVMQPDEPAAKKSKIDAGPEANLIPENIFLQSHKGSVKFQVQVPDIPDKTEWKCQGQKIFLTLPWTDPVSVIKAKLHEEIGMPAGKQKLQLESMFIKDSNTLAYYNFLPSSVVQLQIKERGGRKK